MYYDQNQLWRPTTTIRIPVKRVERPIQCAEYNCGLCLAIVPLVVDPWIKIVPDFCVFLIPAPHLCPPTTIRFPVQSVDRPIRCGESNRGLRLAIASLVVGPWLKPSPIFAFFHPRCLCPSTTIGIPVQSIDRAILCAGSNCGLLLAIEPLVVGPWSKPFPILGFFDSRHSVSITYN